MEKSMPFFVDTQIQNTKLRMKWNLQDLKNEVEALLIQFGFSPDLYI